MAASSCLGYRSRHYSAVYDVAAAMVLDNALVVDVQAQRRKMQGSPALVKFRSTGAVATTLMKM